MDIYRNVGVRLAEIRKKVGISQQSLAERARISVVYMSNLEKGDKKRGTLETYNRLAGALGVTLADLVGQVKPERLPKDDFVSVKGLGPAERRAVNQMVRTLRTAKRKLK